MPDNDPPALPASSTALSAALVLWFREHRRALPWRQQRDAYRVWLSEVMLQQTRVAVVEGYFLRFVARFPDVHALAAAHEDEVLAAWSGLGYYSRGRNLHRAARVVVERFGGAFPSSVAQLRELPGVGPYTAAAIASLAFGVPAAVLDGNVARVLARLQNDDAAVDLPATRIAQTATAQQLVDAHASPGEVNEALMELGALVCTPKSPSCGLCPWRDACAARAAGTMTTLPKKTPKRARTALEVACVVVVDRQRDALWLEKRDGDGLYGGLYAPPSVQLASTSRAALRDAWHGLLAARGIDVPTRMPAAIVVERTLTHRDLRMHAVVVAASTVDGAGRFVPRDELHSVGTSTAVRALVDAALVPPAQDDDAPAASAHRDGARRRRA